jgi:hypothetical protein
MPGSLKKVERAARKLERDEAKARKRAAKKAAEKDAKLASGTTEIAGSAPPSR